MPSILQRNTRTKIEQLYDMARKHRIPIEEDCPEKIVSMSVKLPNGIKIVSLCKSATNATQTECLAHELGHCITDSFYSAYSPFELRSKHELRADKWAIRKLIPFNQLCNAVKEGCRERWQLAECFDVSESFVEKAIDLYAQSGQIVPTEYYEN